MHLMQPWPLLLATQNSLLPKSRSDLLGKHHNTHERKFMNWKLLEQSLTLLVEAAKINGLIPYKSLWIEGVIHQQPKIHKTRPLPLSIYYQEFSWHPSSLIIFLTILTSTHLPLWAQISASNEYIPLSLGSKAKALFGFCKTEFC